MKPLACLCLIIASFGVACSEPEVPGYERVVELDDPPLALLAQGDTVLMAAPAELVKIDDRSRSTVRITDGRYRECPWEPWRTWYGLRSAPQLTPDARFLTITTKSCGSWAWPLADGDTVLQLARRAEDDLVERPTAAPFWYDVAVPVARDGDGWIACGGFKRSVLWSLAADGTPRERLGELSDDCQWISAEADAIYAVHGRRLSRFDRSTGTVTKLGEAEPSSVSIVIAGATPTHFVLIQGSRIVRVPKIGRDVETIVDGSTATSAFGLAAAVDESHVYWSDGRALSRVPLDDISRTEVILGEDDERAIDVRPNIALTKDAIWLTARLGHFASARPWLVRVPKPGR